MWSLPLWNACQWGMTADLQKYLSWLSVSTVCLSSAILMQQQNSFYVSKSSFNFIDNKFLQLQIMPK